MKRFGLVAAVAAAGVLAGCGGSGDPNHLSIAGSTAFGDVATKEAEAFKRMHADAKIDIQSNGSMVGIKNLSDGVCDIAMADLPEIPAEAKEFKAFVVAKDVLAVIVNPKNPVASLTLDQLGKIFSGAVTNWKDVGGPDAEITVVVREENSGGRQAFDKAANVRGRISPRAQSQTTSGALCTAVGNNPNAIGYLAKVKVSDKVKTVAIAGVEPTVENVKTGTYPIFVIIYLFTRGEPSGLAKEYIDFVRGPEGQKVVTGAGMLAEK